MCISVLLVDEFSCVNFYKVAKAQTGLRLNCQHQEDGQTMRTLMLTKGTKSKSQPRDNGPQWYDKCPQCYNKCPQWYTAWWQGEETHSLQPTESHTRNYCNC